MKRIALLVVGLLLVYAVGQYAMNHWTAWTPETKASVWVAVGTLLLAVATAWSVWETRLVIRGEDRRHQQSFAPMLKLVWREGSKANEFHYLILNDGMGMAVNISLDYSGHVNGSTTVPGAVPKPVAADVTDSLSFSQVKGVVEVMITVPPPDGAYYHSLALSKVTLRYHDMFGNPYKTLYNDWQNKRQEFDWEQPDSLKGYNVIG
jgi:hypothetical protein